MSRAVMAEAIHTASRCEASPVSAVTSPPPPRRTLPSSWNVTGPRFDTRTSGARSSLTTPLDRCLGGRGALEHPPEDPQVVAQIARREEVLAHVLLAATPQRSAERGVLENVERSGGTALHAIDQ